MVTETEIAQTASYIAPEVNKNICRRPKRVAPGGTPTRTKRRPDEPLSGNPIRSSDTDLKPAIMGEHQ